LVLKIEFEDRDIDAIANRVAENIKSQPPMQGNQGGDSSIMDVDGLAQYLKVDKQWVYDRVYRNAIPHYKLGKYPRFKKTMIDEWLKKMERGDGRKSPKHVRRLLEDAA
jgi:excisionase family DNA binding protein